MSIIEHEHDQHPCLHCRPQDYIRMVQHLIERCLQFHMSRDDCIKALAKHASIHPIVTLTVWKELLKENKGFFQAYHLTVSPRRRGVGNQEELDLMIKSGRQGNRS